MKGLVIKSTGSWYDVKSENNDIIKCKIKGKFRTKGIKSTNPIAVGDKVEFQLEIEENTGVISHIEERKNFIVRKSTNLSKQSHIIASNIDQALLIITLTNPLTSTGFIDRFLVTAEAYHIPVTLVFNKIDQYNDTELKKVRDLINVYKEIGYSIIESSTISKLNLQQVKDSLENKTTLLSGHSGVGKSTLINAIDPNLNLKTGAISTSHSKGKHTTTFAEMFELEFGGYIIDTPGIKGFGLIYMEKETLSHYFPEMRDKLDECKFNNCLHLKEPGCAIKKAVEEGVIAPSRMQSYLNMFHEDENESYR